MKFLILLVLAVVATQAAVIDPVITIEYQSPDAAEIEIPESPESGALASRDIDAVSVIDVQTHSEKDTFFSRSSITIGFIGIGDRMLHMSYESRRATANVIHEVDEVFRVGFFQRIRFIRVAQVMIHEGARAQIIAGGLGFNTVTIRFSSARGGAYNYYVELWGQ